MLKKDVALFIILFFSASIIKCCLLPTCGVNPARVLVFCASTLSTLGVGTRPSERYKAPHLGTWRPLKHMDVRNSCRDRRDGKVHHKLSVHTGDAGM